MTPVAEFGQIDRAHAARNQILRAHRPTRRYGFMEEAACWVGRHDYDALIRADDEGRLVRNCLRPGCRRTQRLTPPALTVN